MDTQVKYINGIKYVNLNVVMKLCGIQIILLPGQNIDNEVYRRRYNRVLFKTNHVIYIRILKSPRFITWVLLNAYDMYESQINIWNNNNILILFYMHLF